jgi:DNA-binding ferritin-like protein
MSLNIEEIFSCRTITKSSLDLYKTKLLILNDNKPIKNLNYLYDIDKINEKIKMLKPNTRRTYIIAITSILACLNKEDKKPNKKIKKLYADYSKILDEYNSSLRDQTEITEGTQVLSKEDIDKVYQNLKNNRDMNKQKYQDYLILSLYYLTPPRRSLDYKMMKVIKDFSPELSKEFNYYDGSKFFFNAYKTRGKYALQEIEVPNELKQILDFHIKSNNLKDDDFILRDFKNETELKRGNEITLILNRIFKSKVSVSMLRRSFLTNKYGNMSDDLKNDVDKMGTSQDVATNNYIKKKS